MFYVKTNDGREWRIFRYNGQVRRAWNQGVSFEQNEIPEHVLEAVRKDDERVEREAEYINLARR